MNLTYKETLRYIDIMKGTFSFKRSIFNLLANLPDMNYTRQEPWLHDSFCHYMHYRLKGY